MVSQSARPFERKHVRLDFACRLLFGLRWVAVFFSPFRLLNCVRRMIFFYTRHTGRSTSQSLLRYSTHYPLYKIFSDEPRIQALFSVRCASRFRSVLLCAGNGSFERVLVNR